MNLEELGRKIQFLEDLEAIKRLKHQYCAYCDNQYDADGIASLFVEDGVWDGGAFGRCVGREAIREFFRGASKTLTLAAHNVMNPIIDIAGDRATGKWKLVQPCTQETKEGPRAMWLMANYHDDYIRTEAGWKFQSLHVDILFFSPHQSGWIGSRKEKAE
jgi:hypothetical protein